MVRGLLVVVLGIAFALACAYGALLVAQRIECLRPAGHLCEPNISFVLGPIVGFAAGIWIVVRLTKWYARTNAPKAGNGEQAA